MKPEQDICTIYQSVKTGWDGRIGRTIRFCQIGEQEEKTARVEYVAHNGLGVLLRTKHVLKYYLVSQVEYVRNATPVEQLVSDMYGLLPLKRHSSWFSRCRVCNEYAPMSQTYGAHDRTETCGVCGASVRCKTSTISTGITGEYEILGTGERMETSYEFQHQSVDNV